MIRRVLVLCVALAALVPTLAGSHCLRFGPGADDAARSAHAGHPAHGSHAAAASSDRHDVPQRPVDHDGTPGDCPLAMTCIAPAVPVASVRMSATIAVAHRESTGLYTPERYSRLSLEPPPPRQVA